MEKVVIKKVQNYNLVAIEQALTTAFEELALESRFFYAGETVLIKPNLVEAVSVERAVTTHPEVLRALIRVLKPYKVKILVGDSPGYQSTLQVAKVAGIEAVCQEEAVELVDFTGVKEFSNTQAKLVKRFYLAEILGKVDKVISLAKMKTHSLTGVSGAVKNLFGCVVGASKAQFHLRMPQQNDFAQMLIDLHQTVKPCLSIVDGIVGMEGAGPRNGTPINSELILVGKSALAVDKIMADLMGFAGEKMPVTRLALAQGLISPNLKLAEAERQLIRKFQAANNYTSISDRLPKNLVAIAQKQLTLRPIIQANCILCQRCLKQCPPQAIKLSGKKLQINYEQCIRCYCCQEFCPANAISLQAGNLLKFIRYWQKLRTKNK